MVVKTLIPLLGCVAVVNATWAKNLNYRSPSENHPSLGLSVHKIVKRQAAGASYQPSQLNFTHGVASGDPYPNSIIIWTRVAPALDDNASNKTDSGYVPLYYHGPTSDQIKISTAPICVNWKIASDNKLQDVANSGTAFTSSDIDFTVKIEADKLQPFTQYWYQFSVCNSNNTSPLGRTKTAPNADDDVTAVNVAVYSCSNYPFGFFNAYGNPARKDSIDYAIHLGDYIYEYKNGEYGQGQTIGRIPQPDHDIYTLYDYRKRLATYRTDIDLLASHQDFAWITVWDDHEVSDNTYRDGASELNNTEASFVEDGGVSVDQRKMNAVRAYFEWMPIRQVEMDDNLRIWRSFSIGKLFDLVMLDTRHYDRSITDLYWNTDYIHAISEDAGRSLMGSRQENWFYNSLISSKNRGAAWRLIGSQTVFSKLNESLAYGNENPLDYDAWDGYTSNRNRTFKILYDNNIGNNIVLSGDSHASWVTDLVWLDEKAYDPVSGSGSIGVEFGGSAVTSPCPYGANISIATANNYTNWLVTNNPELQWNDLYYRGYYELSITKEKVTAKYFGMPTIVSRNPLEISLANFTVVSGANKLARPVGGGVVESGTLKGGKTVQTNLTHNTQNDTYLITKGSMYDLEVL